MNLFSCLLNILQRSSFELIIISPNKTINKFIGWWKGGRKSIDYLSKMINFWYMILHKIIQFDFNNLNVTVKNNFYSRRGNNHTLSKLPTTYLKHQAHPTVNQFQTKQLLWNKTKQKVYNQPIDKFSKWILKSFQFISLDKAYDFPRKFSINYSNKTSRGTRWILLLLYPNLKNPLRYKKTKMDTIRAIKLARARPLVTFRLPFMS